PLVCGVVSFRRTMLPVPRSGSTDWARLGDATSVARTAAAASILMMRLLWCGVTIHACPQHEARDDAGECAAFIPDRSLVRNNRPPNADWSNSMNGPFRTCSVHDCRRRAHLLPEATSTPARLVTQESGREQGNRIGRRSRACRAVCARMGQVG